MKLRKVLAAIFCIAFASVLFAGTAFADPPAGNTNPAPDNGDIANNAVQEFAEGQNPQVAITKSLATGKDITPIPNASYKFIVEQVKDGTNFWVQDGAPGKEGVYYNVETETNFWATDPIVTIKPETANKMTSTANPQDYSDTTDYYKKESDNIFENITVPKSPTKVNTDGVAIYAYKIYEINELATNDWGGTKTSDYVYEKPVPATTTPGEFNERLKLSEAEYIMYVYTKPTADGTDRYIFAVTVQQTKYDSGSTEGIAGEKKKDPTPGGNPSVKGDFSQLAFQNNYTKVEVTDPEDPNEQPFEVSKKVTGVNNDAKILTAADRPKFKFQVTITKADGDTATSYAGRYWTSTNGSSWVPRDLATHTTTVDLTGTWFETGYTKQDIVTFTFPTGQNSVTMEIELANNEKMTFPGLPAGTTVKVVEDDYFYNKVAGSVAANQTDPTMYALVPTINGAAPLDRTTLTEQNIVNENKLLEARTYTGQVKEGTAKGAAAYQNTGDQGTTPTGIIMNYLPFFLIVALAVAGLLAMVVVKGKRRASAAA